MKRANNVFLIIFIFLTLTSSAQWINIPNPGVPTTIVFPVGNNKIIYAGQVQYSPSSGGYVAAHRADDFGANVRVYYSYGGTGSNPSIVSGAFYNDSTICLHHNISSYGITYTSNGFKNSSFKSVGGSGSYSMFNTSHHLFFLSPKLSYSTDTLMFTRVNAGASEDTVIYLPKYYSGYVNFIPPKISFINDSTGFILARYKSNTSKSVLLKTTNFGDTWNELLIDSVNPVVSYSFPSTQTGYALKATGTSKTTDGGANWYQVGYVLVSSPFVIAFSNDNVGYMGGANGSLISTTNGGMSWTNENTGTTANITGIYTFGPVTYFKTATNTLFKNSPKGVNVNEYKHTLQNVLIYPNPFDGHLTIDVEKDTDNASKTLISIKNIMGQEVYATEATSDNMHISKKLDLTFLNPGIYVISVKNLDLIYTQKVVLSN